MAAFARGPAAARECGDQEDVSVLVGAGEATAGSRPHALLKEPYADVGISACGEAVRAEHDDRVVTGDRAGVRGGVTVRQRVLVGRRTARPCPLAYGVRVLRTAALKAVGALIEPPLILEPTRFKPSGMNFDVETKRRGLGSLLGAVLMCTVVAIYWP